MNKEIIIALCAGEASGDLLGAHLIEALKQQYSRIRFIGIGGPRMKAAGLISSYEQDPLAVRGYVEILGNLREILKIRKGFVEQLKKTSPHVFIGIDSPDFNLPIAAKLKAVGIPTLHYVSPSVWAWKPERVHKIVKQVNKVLCLFPMEPKLYRDAGGRAEYVGHPLAQILPLENSREAVRERLKLGLTTPVFTLLPGSRVSEVEYMAPIFLRTAALIVQTLPEAVFLMPYPSAIIREHLQHYLKLDEFRHLPIRLQAAKTELACMAADVVLVTSGTAALEVALCKRPMVISYRISRFTYALVRRKIKIPYVGLPNILLGKQVVPELLQNDATPEKLAYAVLDWYYHPARVAELEKQFLQLHQRLRRNTNELAAYAVLSEVGVQLPKPDGFGEEVSLTSIDESEQVLSEQAAPEQVSPEQTQSETSSVDAVAKNEHETERQAAPMAMPSPMVVAAHSPSSALPSAYAPKPHTVVDKPTTHLPPHTPANPITVNTIESEMQLSESDMNKSHSKRPTSRKSSGGLFGWLVSLFKKKSVPEQTVREKEVKEVSVPTASSIDASLVAVSRAEDVQVKKVSPVQPAVRQPEKPVRHVIEEAELHEAPVQMNLPKSTILTQHNKTNIFTKYMPEEQQNAKSGEQPSYQAAQPNVSLARSQQPASARESVASSVPTSAVQPVVNPADHVPQTEAHQPHTPAPGSLAKYITQASMAWLPDNLAQPQKKPEMPPSVPETEQNVVLETEVVEPKIAEEHVDCIDVTDLFGSMESVARSVPTETHTTAPALETTTEVVFDDVVTLATESAPPMPAVDTTEVVIESIEPTAMPVVETVVTMEDIPVIATHEPAPFAPVEEMAIPTIAPQPNQDVPVITISTHAASETPKPTLLVPDTQTLAESKAPVIQVAQVAVSANAPTITISPVKSQHTEITLTPVETPVAVEQPVPPSAKTIVETAEIVIEPPKEEENEWANTSFASVFRRHTLQNEQADNLDATHDAIEVEETADEPEQIVLNQTVALSSAPTHAEASTEEGTEAPEVAQYSTNPKRYHGGIFY